MRIAVASLRCFLVDTFVALGMSNADAEDQAHALLVADLRGIDSHGAACIPAYATCLEQGRINSRPDIRIERRTVWASACDGDNGMGHVVATRAMRSAIATAEATGIGVVTVRRTNHLGAACAYALMAAQRNLIGIIMANTSPAVAPWGGAKMLLGTNPIAVAVPSGRRSPFVVDMAMSRVARLKIRKALAKGESIPADWALDPQGMPTTDPAIALTGSLAPIGGPKGFALIALVDVLAGVLSGAQFGGGVLSFLTNLEREADSGNLVICLNPEVFMPLAEFAGRIDKLIDNIKGIAPIDGTEELRVPGEKGAKLTAERMLSGVPFESGVIGKLSELGNRLGIRFPAENG